MIAAEQLRLFGRQVHELERWPLADLLDAAGIRPDGEAWAAEAALRFGVTRRTIHRWRHHGLTTDHADVAAIRADLHPVIVWSAWSCAPQDPA